MPAELTLMVPDDNEPRIEAMTVDQVLERLNRAFTLTVQGLSEGGRCIRRLTELGYDIRKINNVMLPVLRRIGNGQLLPEAILKFGSARFGLGTKIGQLPLADQKRLTEGERVPFAEQDERGNQLATKLLDPRDLTEAQIRQVFASDHIRTADEQHAWLASERAKAATPVPSRVGKFELDPDGNVVKFLGRHGEVIPVADLQAVLKALRK